MGTTYCATRTFDTWRITCESTISMDDAIYQCYAQAYEKGDWTPRELRQQWWQFWRPQEHNEIELRIIAEGKE